MDDLTPPRESGKTSKYEFYSPGGTKAKSVEEVASFERGAQIDEDVFTLVPPTASRAYPTMKISESLGESSETDGAHDNAAETTTGAQRLDQGTEGSDQLSWDQYGLDRRQVIPTTIHDESAVFDSDASLEA